MLATAGNVCLGLARPTTRLAKYMTLPVQPLKIGFRNKNVTHGFRSVSEVAHPKNKPANTVQQANIYRTSILLLVRHLKPQDLGIIPALPLCSTTLLHGHLHETGLEFTGIG